MDLKGKNVLITGASSGIGRAAALEAARRGAVPLLVARTESKLAAVADEIAASGGSTGVFPCDLSDSAAVTALADAVREAHGVPDVLVNNAGAGRWRAIEETPPEEAVEMMQAPYFAGFFATRAFLPGMLERNSGAIAFVNSPACLMGFPGAAGYSAARGAVRHLYQALKGEVRGTNLTVTHFIAGEVSSEYFDNNPDSHDRIPSIAKFYPVMTPEDTAGRLLDAIERGKGEAVAPFLMWVTWVAHEIAPWTVRPLIRATTWRRPG